MQEVVAEELTLEELLVLEEAAEEVTLELLELLLQLEDLLEQLILEAEAEDLLRYRMEVHILQ
jgi:hypothetical protein